MMTVADLTLVVEALRSAQREIEAIEEDADWYVSSGRLMDQIDTAIAILEGELERNL